MTQNEDKQK